jgi:hypothetical protein
VLDEDGAAQVAEQLLLQTTIAASGLKRLGDGLDGRKRLPDHGLVASQGNRARKVLGDDLQTINAERHHLDHTTLKAIHGRQTHLSLFNFWL